MHETFKGLCGTQRPRARTSVCLQRQRSLRGAAGGNQACGCGRGLQGMSGHSRGAGMLQCRSRAPGTSSPGSGLPPSALRPELNQASFTLTDTRSCGLCADELGMWPNQGEGAFLCPLRRNKAKRGLPGDSGEKKPACRRGRHDFDA